MSLRIAYVVPNASFLESGIGGDRVIVNSLRSGLERRGHEVRVASRLEPREFTDGRLSLRDLVREAAAVRRRMKAFAPDVWLVYSSSAELPDLFGWRQPPRRYVLFGAHAPGGLRRVRSWRAKLLWLAHRRSLARADALVAWRPRSAERLRAFGVPEARVRLLLPPAETWDGVPSREEARRWLGLPAEGTIILCAGRFSMARDHGKPKKTEMMLDLIAAVSRLPASAVLLLVGDNGPGRQRLEQEASRVEPPGRVRVVVSLDHAAMPWYYAACDLYAYPHPKDTPWISVMEAQACGRPVVTMRTKSAELSVDEGRTGLLAGDLSEFQDQLAALASDPSRREAMGRRGREYIAERHSLDVRMREIEGLLLGDPRHETIHSQTGGNGAHGDA